MRDLARLSIRYLQGMAGFRKDDILLGSFPKSGSTWVRFFFCNVISLCEWDGKAVDFQTMNRTMPELGVDNLMQPWPHRSIPRVVKTHRNLHHLFTPLRVLLVLRDPRDVMVSFFHYEKAREKIRFRGGFPEFIRHCRFGLKAWFRHYAFWNRHAAARVLYEDLRASDTGGFQQMMKALSISADEAVIRSAAVRSRFGEIRRMEEKNGQGISNGFRPGFHFTRSGETGQWQEAFRKEDIRWYAHLRKKYALDIYE